MGTLGSKVIDIDVQKVGHGHILKSHLGQGYSL